MRRSLGSRNVDQVGVRTRRSHRRMRCRFLASQLWQGGLAHLGHVAVAPAGTPTGCQRTGTLPRVCGIEHPIPITNTGRIGINL